MIMLQLFENDDLRFTSRLCRLAIIFGFDIMPEANPILAAVAICLMSSTRFY